MVCCSGGEVSWGVGLSDGTCDVGDGEEGELRWAGGMTTTATAASVGDDGEGARRVGGTTPAELVVGATHSKIPK